MQREGRDVSGGIERERGADKESNWLPAPNGPIYMVMRLYWPKEDALDGKWKPPAVTRQ
jgi:hypothetical protein